MIHINENDSSYNESNNSIPVKSIQCHIHIVI